ncbi:hypothetical protein BLNAU_10666 [Blattamonas nauphoetae]|uniref:Uncharacterized protein n=1 Tax=Blattamonas nauphoetae TaxID=2049346 RepID=A0ABQ9XR80_9EUKA|nr:hypothetical protein BLNAU_10666 [Blattamonas nauphoetae]
MDGISQLLPRRPCHPPRLCGAQARPKTQKGTTATSACAGRERWREQHNSLCQGSPRTCVQSLPLRSCDCRRKWRALRHCRSEEQKQEAVCVPTTHRHPMVEGGDREARCCRSAHTRPCSTYTEERTLPAACCES